MADDTQAPTYTGLVLPANIVTSPSGVLTAFEIDASDLGGSGFASGTITLDRPLQTPDGPVSTLSLQVAGASPDQYRALLMLPVTSATGTGIYHVIGASVVDFAGNSQSYEAQQFVGGNFAFTVDDRTAPTLTSLHLTTVDVTNQAALTNATAAAIDAGGNLAAVTLTFDKPLEYPGYQGHGVSFDYPSAILTLNYSYGADGNTSPLTSSGLLGRTTKAGEYTVIQAVVTDKAGNSTTYKTDQLHALGYDTVMTVKADSVAPVLTVLLLPEFTNPNADNYGKFVLQGVDTGSGDSRFYAALQLDHPIGASQYASVQINEPLSSVFGTTFYADQSGSNSSVAVHLSTAQSPLYHVTGVELIDTAGNEVDYSPAQLQAMGFATSFVTNSAALFAATHDDQMLTAPYSGNSYFSGNGTVRSTVALNGNMWDYQLSRLQTTDDTPDAAGQIGAFVLTAVNGSGSYTIEQSVDTVRFQNGQTLPSKDLVGHVAGDPGLSFGGDSNDLLYQNPSKAYQLFVGGGGLDTVYLNGSAKDYTLRSFDADSLTNYGQGLASRHTAGLELIAINDSGQLLIDSSVETIHFKDGQTVSYADLLSTVAVNAHSATDQLTLNPDGALDSSVYATGVGERQLLVQGNPVDYTLSRDVDGNFVLDGSARGLGEIHVGEDVANVKFGSGEYLALTDLHDHVAGSDIFTNGSNQDDLLIVPFTGDQYVRGLGGSDTLLIHGNTQDYTLKTVAIEDYVDGHPPIDGYELVANNGSGNIYIDQTIEHIHLQSGQTLAFSQLPNLISQTVG